jgi:hypothetical protein
MSTDPDFFDTLPKTRDARRRAFRQRRDGLIGPTAHATIHRLRRAIVVGCPSGRRSEPGPDGYWIPSTDLAAMDAALDHAMRQLRREQRQVRA